MAEPILLKPWLRPGEEGEAPGELMLQGPPPAGGNHPAAQTWTTPRPWRGQEASLRDDHQDWLVRAPKALRGPKHLAQPPLCTAPASETKASTGGDGSGGSQPNPNLPAVDHSVPKEGPHCSKQEEICIYIKQYSK